MQSSATVGRTDTMVTGMALKSGGSVHILTPTVRNWEIRTPGPPQDRYHWYWCDFLECCTVL